MGIWCIQKNIWVSATHIPGVTNVEADKKSRQFDVHTEWALNDQPVNRCLAKDPGGISRGYTDNTPVAYTTVVPCGNANVGQPPTDFAQNATFTLLASNHGEAELSSSTKLLTMRQHPLVCRFFVVFAITLYMGC
ncbi:Hypothetical predicted protein [Paramuricea clavata]|uniref:Uncharacterized protein n=1 Tax=Paramuricea clavata TaxID=317549 RepID=A0A7D9DT75_PARCT|nr:Hypothetical predicted protein [Paramuricea clavata]